MKQDMLVVLDLGSTRNTDVARAIRALGVYSEICNYDVTAQELLSMPNVRGIVANGGPNDTVDGVKITLSDEVKKSGLPLYTFDYAGDGALNPMPEDDADIQAALKSFVFGTCKAEPNWNMENFIADQVELIRRQVGGKKVLLANVFYELITTFKASDDRSVLFYWLYAVACVLNIYFDFSGYSDMAIGLGRIFGFRYLENFDYPYISASITEFWRRWHMSLGSWFRDYVYIPLGGNRVSKTKWLRNILVVWLLTGLWHGAAWNFVLWGLFFAVFLTVEKLWYGRALAKTRVFKHIYVLLLVVVSFVLFDANSVEEAAAAIGGLFGAAGVSAVNPISLYYLRSFAVVFLIGIVGATPLPKRIVEQLGSTRAGAMVVDVLEPLVLVSVLAVSTGYLVDGSFNPFLYFRF